MRYFWKRVKTGWLSEDTTVVFEDLKEGQELTENQAMLLLLSNIEEKLAEMVKK